MNSNPLAIKTRDLITLTLIELTELFGEMAQTDPDFPVLQAILHELSQLNFKVVVDDINLMADTLNQHNAELQKLTEQIQGTTEKLTNLSVRLQQVSSAVAFLVDTFAKAATLGLL